jgi:hypothetical protein
MPPTPDKIPDKVPFDVYAMLIILTFLFTGGATLMINDRLSKEWQFWDDKATIKNKSVHLTQMNPDPAKYPEGLVVVQDVDKDEWKLIDAESQSPGEFPHRDFDWPAGYDPMQYPVKFKEDFLGPKEDTKRRDAFQKLADAKVSGVVEKTSTGPAPAPADAPKADAPKADAPKADAPKADAPKTDAPKADEKK